ncbi:MAG TPA: hypothetical protein DCE42_01730 [Myxococcales bacterium]|nr:hypothetical protein [Deltaproteobacteria bacterium]HAA53444.1 hypothetical protein [Myxococcales bacterium]|tara:strand:+ start:4743 stop:5456 length:714 start_codon:yes stop_codon:yes gene_type:complete
MGAPPTSNKLIQCDDISVQYGEHVIFAHANVSFERGAFVAVTGPNGSGKTTFLRMLLRLIPTSSGTLHTDFHEHSAGYVPQSRHIDPIYPVTAYDIIAMGLYKELGWWRRLQPQHKEKIEGLLTQFGLQEAAYQRFSALSGGMKQKVLIARALVSGAEVFIFDEPFTGLDTETQEEVLHIIMELHRDGKTLFMTLHGADLEVVPAEQICLVKGQRVQLCSREDYLNSHTTSEVDKHV